MSTPSKQLYEIWHVGTQTYRLADVLLALQVRRDEVISTDHAKLQKVCDRFNVTKFDNEHYEIRRRLSPV